MNIRIPDSWLREYLKTSATPKQIKDSLSLCGPSVERIYIEGNESIYDIEITSNRIDSASVYGIAREAAAILPRFSLPAKLNKLKLRPPLPAKSPVPMEIEDPDEICNRIMGIVLDIDPMKSSPEYMKNRLEKSGVRSLNTLVDITNYVMLEVGHPCHVFDYDRIKTHRFLIRQAKDKEPIVTLDNKKYLLSGEDVIIDDGTGRVIDLPGIMGTENSIVTADTRRIFFFIESNNPIFIRKTSMRYGIRTMAATINEKHPDPNLVKIALFLGIELYQEVAGGKIAGEVIDIYPKPAKPNSIDVTENFIEERLGIHLPEPEIISILTSLQFDVKKETKEIFRIIPPTFRQFDVTIPEDIVEEVARIYGYHNLPGNLMEGKIPTGNHQNLFDFEEKAKTTLKYLGFTEIYTYSFISKALIQKSGLTAPHLQIANPLTEEIEYMRMSLLPSLLCAYEKNLHVKDNLSLFELSNVYEYKDSNAPLPTESLHLAIASSRPLRELKGILIALLAELGLGDILALQKTTAHFFHPKQSGLLTAGKSKDIVALFGTIHPDIARSFSVPESVTIADMYFSKVVSLPKRAKSYIPLSLYPPVIEDITLLYNSTVAIEEILRLISTRDPRIKTVEFLEQYNETITLRISYQDETKNLTNEEVRPIRTKILSALEEKYGMKLKQ